MCGRFTITDEELVKKNALMELLKPRFSRSFNVAPSQGTQAIKAPKDFAMLKWGLIPSWQKIQTSEIV